MTKNVRRPTRRPAAPPARDSEDTRRRLVAAAADVVAEQGLQAATVQEIARAAGANHGLVHYYFGGKNGLLLEVVRDATARYARAFAQLRQQVDAGALGGAALALASRVVRDDLSFFRLRLELLVSSLANPSLRADAAELLATSRRDTAALLAALPGGDGLTRRQAHARAALLVAVFDGLALQAMLDESVDVDAAVRLLAPLLAPAG